MDVLVDMHVEHMIPALYIPNISHAQSRSLSANDGQFPDQTLKLNGGVSLGTCLLNCACDAHLDKADDFVNCISPYHALSFALSTHR